MEKKGNQVIFYTLWVIESSIITQQARKDNHIIFSHNTYNLPFILKDLLPPFVKGLYPLPLEALHFPLVFRIFLSDYQHLI